MTVDIGFAKCDITPRVGVELCGFGPYINRHSTGVRDRLWARAMALRSNGQTVVVVSCDLVGVALSTTRRVRELVTEEHDLSADAVMICCSHTHSGPAPDVYIGWGDADQPYLEVLPHRIARAATDALSAMQEARLCHAEIPCEGLGINREYERFWADYEEAIRPEWRPDKPELTDTICHVLAARDPHGKLLGFATYFGCHPVVCCSKSFLIHGDYPGVALNSVERDQPGTVGLFFQGAQGDVNTAVGGKLDQDESLLALDEMAGRFARAVRRGIRDAEEVDVSTVAFCRRDVAFSRKPWDESELRRRLQACEEEILKPGEDGLPSDHIGGMRLNVVFATALRRLLARKARGETLEPPSEVQGVRLGPVALLGGPFETFQAIKNDVRARAKTPIPLVTSFANDSIGYAVDETCAERGGYAADNVPLMCGELPFANIHRELVDELVALDAELAAAKA